MHTVEGEILENCSPQPCLGGSGRTRPETGVGRFGGGGGGGVHRAWPRLIDGCPKENPRQLQTCNSRAQKCPKHSNAGTAPDSAESKFMDAGTAADFAARSPRM